MKFSEDIFKKATIRGIADYLLFGEVPLEEKRDYEARVEDAHARFKAEAKKLDSETSSKLLDLADEMVGENINVYMEIGMQAGILLMLDMYQNINAERYKNCSEVENG